MNEGATARAGRQLLETIVLWQVVGQAEHVEVRKRRRRPYRHAAHLLRRHQIPLHQRRREPEHTRDVVEAITGVISREELADVDIEREQIPHGVPVFRAVEAMKRFDPTGVRPSRGRRVQLCLQPGHEALGGGHIRARPARRRHDTGAHLSDHLLPELGVRPQVRQVEMFEGDRDRTAVSLDLVVAGQAIPIEQRALLRVRRCRGCGLCLRTESLQAPSHEGYPHCRQQSRASHHQHLCDIASSPR